MIIESDHVIWSFFEPIFDICKIVDPEFDSVLAQFGISKADYERMSIEELAEPEEE